MAVVTQKHPKRLGKADTEGMQLQSDRSSTRPKGPRTDSFKQPGDKDFKGASAAAHAPHPSTPNGLKSPTNDSTRREHSASSTTKAHPHSLSHSEKIPRHESSGCKDALSLSGTKLRTLGPGPPGPRPNGPTTPPHNPPRTIGSRPETGWAGHEPGHPRVRPPSCVLQEQQFICAVSLRHRLGELNEWCTLALEFDRLTFGNNGSDEWGRWPDDIACRIKSSLYGVERWTVKSVKLESMDNDAPVVSRTLLHCAKSILQAEDDFQQQWLTCSEEKGDVEGEGHDQDRGYMVNNTLSQLTEEKRDREFSRLYEKMKALVEGTRGDATVDHDICRAKKALQAQAHKLTRTEVGK